MSNQKNTNFDDKIEAFFVDNIDDFTPNYEMTYLVHKGISEIKVNICSKYSEQEKGNRI